LTTKEERLDFRREIFTSSIKVIPEFIFGRSERKLDGLQGDAPSADSRSVATLVQDCAKVVSDIEKDTWERLWRISREPEFVDFMSRIGLFIDDFGPRMTFPEVGNCGIEVLDVVLSSLESEARTVEDVSHGGETRSYERA
jgi:hypothetical protein